MAPHCTLCRSEGRRRELRHRLAVARDDDLLPLLHGVNQFGEPPLRFGHADIHVLNDDYIFCIPKAGG